MGLSWCAASFYGQNLKRVSLQTDGAPFKLANDGKLHIALNFMIQYQAIKLCGLVGFPLEFGFVYAKSINPAIITRKNTGFRAEECFRP
jgi:hypothetical protein